MAKRDIVKERVIELDTDPSEKPKPNFMRMDLAAAKYGVTVAFFKDCFLDGTLTRFKWHRMTFINTNQIDDQIVPGTAAVTPPYQRTKG